MMDTNTVTETLYKEIVKISKKPIRPLVTFSLIAGLIFLGGALISNISFNNNQIAIEINKIPNKILLTLGSIYFIGGISIAAFTYIEGEKRLQENNDSDSLRNTRIKKIDELLELLQKPEYREATITDVDYEENVEPKQEDLTSKLIENYLSEIIKNNYKYSSDPKATSLSQIDEHIKELQSGVNKQIERLSRSGTINLIIGLLTTLAAITVLINLVLTSKPTSFTSTNAFLLYSIPRASLAIFVEIFSFFFLRLYKANLEDVKYFHNERTNIDSKVIALKLFLSLENSKLAINVVKSFLGVERNFILKKEETTIGIEQSKISNLQETDLLSKLADVIEKIKK